VIKLRETIPILDLHQQGLTVSAISRETDIGRRKTVRKCIERDLEAPAYGPRKPRGTLVFGLFASCLRVRAKTYPGRPAVEPSENSGSEVLPAATRP
jgi:hypothetical protein